MNSVNCAKFAELITRQMNYITFETSCLQCNKILYKFCVDLIIFVTNILFLSNNCSNSACLSFFFLKRVPSET